MIKGQVISGEYGKIIIRQKSNENIEIGELLISDTSEGKYLLQVIDLTYGSQISQLNLEMVSGLNLEEEEHHFIDNDLRNYNLAYLKPVLFIGGKDCRMSKSLPPFFSTVREINENDLSFITKPNNPFHIGKLRSGSKEMDLDIFLAGRDVFSHHVLIPATTGKGKSLDENEEVLVKTNDTCSIKSIGELVNNNSHFQGSEVLSMNPKNHIICFKKITKFVKHKAPRFMYQVTTTSGREILITEDHNLYVLQNGALSLLKTQEITNEDYLPLPLKIKATGKVKKINLFELLRDEDEIYVLYNKTIIQKLKSKTECLKILSKNYSDPLQKYNDFIRRKNRIRITLLKELLSEKLSSKDFQSIRLTDRLNSLTFDALYPITTEFLQFLGYYIAEGYCPNDNTFRISCSEKPIQQHLAAIFESFGLNCFWIKKKDKNVDVGASSSIFTKIIKKIGLGRVSGNKRLPEFFMSLSNKDLKTLLQTYFEGDGGVDREKVLRKKNFQISATTKSKKLSSDLCFALLRFGILARTRKVWKKATNTNHKRNWYYRISISGKSNLVTFLSKVGFQFERKRKILDGMLDHQENTNVDVIPCDPQIIRKIRLSLRLPQEKFSKLCNCSQATISAIELGKRRPSRALTTALITIFNEQLSRINHSLFERLTVFSNSPAPTELAKIINNARIASKLTFFELGKKSGMYTKSRKHYIERDLGRILCSRTVKNSPKVYHLGKFLSHYSHNESLTKFSKLFQYNYTDWSNIVAKALSQLNFPHQAMQREKQHLGYYARRLKKGRIIGLKSLRELAQLLCSYYILMREAELLVIELKKLLGFRWDKIEQVKKVKYKKKYVYDLTVKDNKTFLAGHGGIFVHNSNLMSCILWDTLDKSYCGMLVLDPHDEYYGRNELGLKDHSSREKVSYYTLNPPVGAKTLKIHLNEIKPIHFKGVYSFSEPQRQALSAYYRRFGNDWISAILRGEDLTEEKFFRETLDVIKRTLMELLNIDVRDGILYCSGVFDSVAGPNTIPDICKDLEDAKTVIIDTSSFSGTIELLIGSLASSEIFRRYKSYKNKGILSDRPVVAIVLEEAPRVLGKKVLEEGSNIFEQIAREGRKFQVGLVAITQLPSEIPKNILANMNTKIILGIEMGSERQAVIESSPQDLSQDNRTIASLDKGEAIVTSTFTRFAVPIKIPLFKEFVKKKERKKFETNFAGFD